MIKYRVDWEVIHSDFPHPYFGIQTSHHNKTKEDFSQAIELARELSVDERVKNVKLFCLVETQLPIWAANQPISSLD